MPSFHIIKLLFTGLKFFYFPKVAIHLINNSNMLLNTHYIVSLEKRIKQISFQIIPQINLIFFVVLPCFLIKCAYFCKTYRQIDNYCINQIFRERMKRRFVLLLACLLAGIGLAIAQTPKEITGVVISEEDNQPVVGHPVLVKGTTIGTTTNLDGKFTISNAPSSARTK